MNDKSVLITGGTGSFGKQFVKTVLQKYPKINRLVIFSRDELKQYEMEQMYPREQFPQLRFFIGDVRDFSRISRALEGIDYVIHAAALKHVPIAEYTPFEFIKTNVIGAENIINACLDNNVKKIIALSTDKAAAPINLYGASKLCSDKLFTAANNMRGNRDILFSVVRYGNVMGSRGSVIPFFLQQKKTGVLPITDPGMTRFNITLQQGVDFVLYTLEHASGGEIFVPKLPSYNIKEVAKAIGPDCEHKVVGIRPGEKLHEEMITETDSLNTYEFDSFYTILSQSEYFDTTKIVKKLQGKKVSFGFKYNSGNNNDWLDAEKLRNIIQQELQVTL
jgi:UDP-N-acetylglucosamine 4,6-dehydratase (inverting)